MNKHITRILFIGVLTLILFASSGGPRAGLAVVPKAPGGAPLIVMPPHPRIQEKIDQGLTALPQGYLARRAQFGDQIALNDTLNASEAPAAGTINTLAVLVKFSDKNSQVSASFFDRLIFDPPVSGRGSVRDYYSAVSYGQVDIVTLNLPSELGWRSAPSSYATYVAGANCVGAYPLNCQKLAEDIAMAINGLVDFSDYDNDGDGVAEPLLIIHAGPGAELTGDPTDVWSHSWSLRFPKSLDGVVVSDYVIMPEYWMVPGDMTIGVFAHEMGHGFWNLPDLYDTDYSSAGIGSWSLMAGGSWNGPSGMGDSPAWPDAWSRIQMGFDTPVVLSTGGTHYLSSVSAGSSQTDLYKIRPAGMPQGEYYLLENRTRSSGSYDEYLPGSGLLIWHIDEAMSGYGKQNDLECDIHPKSDCDSGSHYLVALEQADGLFDLERYNNRGDDGDPFPGVTSRRAFSLATVPGSHSYYSSQEPGFAISGISGSKTVMDFQLALPPSAFQQGSPANAAAVPPGTVTLDWQDSPGASSYEYCLRSAAQSACPAWVRVLSSEVSLSGLTQNTTYSWQVRALNSLGTTYAGGSSSSFWTFRFIQTTPPGGFNRTAPLDGAVNLPPTLLLDWEDSPGAADYAYCAWLEGTACGQWATTGGPSQVQLTGLMPGVTYVWQVRAINEAGQTYSLPGENSFWFFSTQPALVSSPETFAKLSPADGAADQPTDLTLRWQASAQAEQYDICLKTSPDADCVDWIRMGSVPELALTGLSTQTRYYWQVRALNANGMTYADDSPLSYWSFSTRAESFSADSYAIFLPMQIR